MHIEVAGHSKQPYNLQMNHLNLLTQNVTWNSWWVGGSCLGSSFLKSVCIQSSLFVVDKSSCTVYGDLLILELKSVFTGSFDIVVAALSPTVGSALHTMYFHFLQCCQLSELVVVFEANPLSFASITVRSCSTLSSRARTHTYTCTLVLKLL